MRRILPLLIALILPAAAFAQIAPRSAPPIQPERPREPLPNAVPGARAQPGAAERTRQNLGPNEALFDAINRGDLRDARDAITRGADLNSRNVLGLTPLELSVDLGRNDISFMLLSMRGAAGSAPSPRGRETGIGGEPPRIAAPARSRQPTVPVQAAPPSLPRLWAGDGGTPQPDIGFLGFDAGRPEGARAPAGARRGG